MVQERRSSLIVSHHSREIKGEIVRRRSFLIVGAGLLLPAGGTSGCNKLIHVGMLGDSIFDNGAYTGGAADVRAQVQSLLPSAEVTSAAKDGAVMADIVAQLNSIPHSATHLVLASEATTQSAPQEY